MRILVNAMSARQGGGQTYLRNLFAHLPGEAPDGSAVEVFLVAPAALHELAAPGRIEYLPVSPLAENPFARAPWERFVLPRLVRRLSADILFSPGGTTTLRPPAPCRSVTMFRNMIPFDMAQRRRYPPGYQRVRNWLLERIMLDAMTGADLVIFISDYARQVVEARAGGPMRASVVIPHGVSDRFRVGTQPLPAPGWVPQEGYFLYVSTLDFYKNQLEVMRGFLQAKAAVGFAEKLLIVGPGNPVYVSLLRKEIAERGAQAEDPAHRQRPLRGPAGPVPERAHQHLRLRVGELSQHSARGACLGPPGSMLRPAAHARVCRRRGGLLRSPLPRCLRLHAARAPEKRAAPVGSRAAGDDPIAPLRVVGSRPRHLGRHPQLRCAAAFRTGTARIIAGSLGACPSDTL